MTETEGTAGSPPRDFTLDEAASKINAIEAAREESEASSAAPLPDAAVADGPPAHQFAPPDDPAPELPPAPQPPSDIDRQMARFIAEFEGVSTPDDLVALAERDPAAFARFQAKAVALAHRLVKHRETEARERSRFVAREAKKLRTMFPALAEPTAARGFFERLGAYAGKLGFAPQELAGAGAREIAILHKAMQWDAAEANAGSARARSLPRVQAPGSRSEAPTSGFDDAMARLKRTGRVEDAAQAIKFLIDRR